MTERVAHAARYANAIKIIPPEIGILSDAREGLHFRIFKEQNHLKWISASSIYTTSILIFL